ncbi:hypothetical protein [Kordia sp.]|uniref:hypothetical protein n=1 Tax=Kordia sp. TaxID=1965332 RepID=UPI0025C2FEA1|nr:hypothetical protein [Kordia sp.]MCH2197011.1 hypothetical protein [Kordia sp.]
MENKRKIRINIILLILMINFTSCHNNKEYVNKLEGNWYSIQDNTYLEYFIKKNEIYVYSVAAGYLYKYDYIIRNDSIFNKLDENLKTDDYKFYNKILKISPDTLHFSYRKLIRLDNENSLEDLILKKINKEEYVASNLKREEKNNRSN